MKTNQIFLLLIIIPGMLKAQLNDCFTDGDFTSAPAWFGDSEQFKINSSYQLQLNSSGENSSCLATTISISDSMEWNFWVKQSFSPSNNNYSKIYLLSDQQNLKGPINGYFLKLGESGSTDAIELFRQSGNTETSLCRGTPGLIATSFATRIKVIRSASGTWKLLADPFGGTEYKPQAEAIDSSNISGSWFGIVCKYTSSNSTKFFFDNIYAGPVLVDTILPELLSASVLTANHLKLQFSEDLDSASSTNPLNFTVDTGIGNPVMAERESGYHSRVFLSFSQEFMPDVTYTLTLSHLKDLAGNTMVDRQIPFNWHSAKSFDILINEVMCDPDPQVALPNFEYIELYNRTAYPIDLGGWSITINDAARELPTFQLLAGGFVILTEDAAQFFLESYGPAITFPSLTLVNTGGTLTLRNQQGGVVHSICYSDEWYRSVYKASGGWSLEIIDNDNPCGEMGNWIASINYNGGTPGKVNSVKTVNPDIQQPKIIRAGITDSLHIHLTFSETLDSLALTDRMNYSIDNGIGSPESVSAHSPDYRQVILALKSSIERGKIYTLTLHGSMIDCAGNLLPSNSSACFALAERANPSDLVINEILFDPVEGCIDFVEVYNRSKKVLDLSDLTLSNYDTSNLILTSISEISAESLLALPGDYFALSSDTMILMQCYSIDNSSGIIPVKKLPPLNNEWGTVAIALKNGIIIDRFNYSADMQYPILVSSEGVSLERISPERPSSDLTNWHSASGSAGYATPAAKNSQYSLPNNESNEIHLSPEIFSPDNDGHDDVLNIAYSFSASGYNSTVTVFDVSGHLVRNLVINELCGTSGCWSWDGTNNKHEKAPIGRYIVYIEAFDLQGNVKKYKRTSVLGGFL